MATRKCGVCGAGMKKNGFTKAGKQRWRCKGCGSSKVVRNDTASRRLRTFVSWLLGKPSQAELSVNARTFRGRTHEFWKIWPIIPICDEVHHVVYMDGIWLSRKCVVLIACTDEHVVGCHLARTENSRDWGCLMRRIAPPDVLVCDGGGGIEKARRGMWPGTRVQRCTFHAFCQVKRCTTTRPKTQAGVDLYAIAKDLMRIRSQREAAEWLARFHRWCADYEDFLKERSDDGRHYRHERLRKARKALVALCNAGTLFTYLDEGLAKDGPVPSMSNKIENLNGRIRRMLVSHRGMGIDHRIKAIFWFCYMNSECPKSFAQMLETFPDDDKVREWRMRAAEANGDETGAPARWGEGLVWSEFRHSTSYPYAVD
ncbi:IS1249 family transposase [Xiamenia xianingshaonis]|nr:IS1249 family transposase [Xiamenia xianingshaonis]